MSEGDIDSLMDMWVCGKSESEDLAPFDSHKHLHATIDAVKLGNAPWKSFKMLYAGEIGPNAPTWQTTDYEVCYRDPSVVVANMLDNPDFDGEIDYSPYVELNRSGERCWNEFLSANLSWRHAVGHLA